MPRRMSRSAKSNLMLCSRRSAFSMPDGLLTLGAAISAAPRRVHKPENAVRRRFGGYSVFAPKIVPDAVRRDADARRARLPFRVGARKIGEPDAAPPIARFVLARWRLRMAREGRPFVERRRSADDLDERLRENRANERNCLAALAVEGKRLQNLDRIGSGLERAALGEKRARLIPVDRNAKRFDIARFASGENPVAEFGDGRGQKSEIENRGRNDVANDVALGFTDHGR